MSSLILWNKGAQNPSNSLTVNITPDFTVVRTDALNGNRITGWTIDSVVSDLCFSFTLDNQGQGQDQHGF